MVEVERTKVACTVFVEVVGSVAMWCAQLAWLFSRPPFYQGFSFSPGTGLFCGRSQIRGSDRRIFWGRAKVHDLGPFLCRDLCLVLRTKVAYHLCVGALVVSGRDRRSFGPHLHSKVPEVRRAGELAAFLAAMFVGCISLPDA